MANAKETSGALRGSGLRSTAAGRGLLDVLSRLKKPTTAKALHQLVKSQGWDLATVHRLLMRFEKAGLVRATHLHGKSRWYERLEPGVHHHHLVCTRCQTPQRFAYCAVRKLEAAALRENGFQVLGHSVTLYGLCSACRTRGENHVARKGRS